MAQHSNVQSVERLRVDFDSLVQAHYAGLFRFAMSLTRSETDACDLVQETFLTWAEKGHQLESASKVKSWLFTTLHRLFLGTRRRAQRFPEVDLEEAGEEVVSFELDLVRRLDGARIVEMLSRVDEQYRTAVVLFYLEDYPYEEIGTILGVPLGTVKSRISRGIQQLKRIVAQEDTCARGGEDGA